MARKKVKLAWIASDQSRKATLKKRKRGLMKKVSELSTLCGVSACAVIFSPNEPLPEIWPPYPETQRVLLRFKTMPEIEQGKKMLNQEGFLKHQILRLKENLRRQEKDNRDREITVLMYEILAGKGLQYLTVEVLSALTTLVDSKLKTVQERIEFLKMPPLPHLTDENMALDMAIEAYNKQQWLMEMLNSNDFRVGGVEDSVMPFGFNSSPWFDPSLP